MIEEYGLRGRVAIITGATGSIGGAIATEFYNQGAQVVLTGRRHDELEKLSANLTANQTKYQLTPLCVPLDLTATDADKTLVSAAIEKFDRLDIVINNAGDINGYMFLKTTPEILNRIMNLNFTVPYNICRTALPHMLRGKYGRIINITSIAGYFGDAGMSAYAASKGGLASATKSIATEYGRRNITANCIAPGVIDTPQIQKIPAERRKELRNLTPAHRFGKPEEVAHLASFLASERAAFINGQQIHINGGLIR